MPQDEAVMLSGLLCSRLCHDLIGPAGAIANGLELCEDPAMAQTAMALLGNTSDELSRRLAFFRRAYGTGTGLTWDEARELTQAYLGGRRHSMVWVSGARGQGCEEAVLARLLMNLILVAVEAFPGGGEMSVTTGPVLRIEVAGALADPESLLAAFHDVADDWSAISPRDVQLHLTARLARSAGGKITVQHEPGTWLVLTFGI